MIGTITKYIRGLIESGVSAQTGPELGKRIKLSNVITLTTLFFIVPYTFIFYLLGYKWLGIILVPIALSLCPIFHLNGKGHTLISRIWLITVINIALGIYAVIFGRDSGIHMLYFVFVGMPFMIFGFNEIAHLVFSIILPTTFFYLIQFGPVQQFENADTRSQQVIYICMMSLIILWTIINYAYFSLASKQKEDKLEQLQRKFKDLLNRAPDAMVLCDQDGTIQLVNNRFKEVFGFNTSEVMEKKINTIIGDTQVYHDNNKFAEDNSATIGNHKVRTVDQVLKRKDGSEFQAELSTTWIEMDEGPMLSTSIRDVTERKQLEALKIQAAQTEARNNELEQFAYLVSHDLKAPVKNAMHLIELLNEGKDSQEDKDQMFTLVSRSVRRMYILINDLLAYSSIGKRQEIVNVNCMEVIDEIKQDLSSLISQSGVKISVGRLPTFKGQKTSIRLLFQNLLNNAIKFRRNDIAPTVEIASESQKGYWKFSICDNGIGIDMEYGNKIFDIFQRLHSSDAYEGSGIGLAHCKKIIDQHGGSIWVESEPNRGSTFFFTIPNAMS